MTDRPELDLVPLGDRAWLARFADESAARGWALAARRARLPGVVDVVLAYRSASVHVDPDRVDWEAMEGRLRRIDPVEASEVGRPWTIPVLYDGDDLDEVARALGMTPGDVAATHAGRDYHVFAIGFQPGFPYLGYLPPPLDRLQRRAEPRLRVPAGSVAIAAGQTGIYPADLPGGWNLIGRTPLTIVDLDAEHFPIRAGDRVRFAPIDAGEYDRRRGEVLR